MSDSANQAVDKPDSAPDDARALAGIIARPLELDPIDDLALDDLRRLVAQRLRDIIDHRFSTLAQILYQLDLDEESVEMVFSTARDVEIPEALAELIIQRCLLRLELRRRMRSIDG